MRELDPVTNHLLKDWRKSRPGEGRKTRAVKIPIVTMEHIKEHCAENEIPQGRFIEEVLKWYLMTQVYSDG